MNIKILSLILCFTFLSIPIGILYVFDPFKDMSFINFIIIIIFYESVSIFSNLFLKPFLKGLFNIGDK